MGELKPTHENCCPTCAAKIDAMHAAITQIASVVGSLDLDSLGNSMVGKMLGLGKK
jgi:hypothetical protein